MRLTLRFLMTAACCAAILSAQAISLSFNPVAAQYSSALDRIVMISSSPNLLHIYNPAANSDVTVPLGSVPSSLSVSPDGLHAAAGASNAVYYVDLVTASVVNTYPGGIGIGSVLLSNSALYITPVVAGSNNYYQNTTYVDLGAGQSTALSGSISGAGVNPVNGQIYQAVAGTPGLYGSPSVMYRLVVNGTEIVQKAWPYEAMHPVSGSLWFSPDGSRVYAANGTVVNSSTNAAEDMTYVSSVPSGYLLEGLAESASGSQVAYISQVPSYATTPPVDDVHVNLLTRQYLTPTGSFALTPFTVGGTPFAAHGRFVFFSSDSSKLYVLNQADTTSGLTNDYAVQTIKLAHASACTVTLDSSNVQDEGDGGIYAVNITAGTDCSFTASADSPWINFVSGAYGSGNTGLTFELQRNSTGQVRNGSIAVDGQTIAITQETPAAEKSFVPLSFNVVAGEYDKTLDRFVMLSAAPNQLHIFDPVANVDQALALGPTPLSLSLSADGKSAIVGHNGWLSSVDLVNRQVLKVYILQDVASIVALGTNGYAYTFQQANEGSGTSLNLNTGVATQGGIPGVDAARLGPFGHKLYVGQPGLFDYDLRSNPVITYSPGLGFLTACGGIWFTQDGARLLTGCAEVFTVSDDGLQDLRPDGSAPLALYGFRWPDDSQTAGTIVAIPGGPQGRAEDDTVQFFARDTLNLLSQTNAAAFSVAGKSYSGYGHVVSWNSAGSTVFVLEQADSSANLVSSYAISTIANPSSLPPCAFTVDASAIAVGSDVSSITLPGRSTNCSWTYTTDASWITPIEGMFATYPGRDLTAQLQNNPAATSRSGHIVIGGQSIAITQDGAGCSFQFPLADIGAYSHAATQGIAFTTSGSNCGWSATTHTPWITINGPSSGMGSGNVSVSIAENASGSFRNGSLLIAGHVISIGQLSTPPPGPTTGLGFVPVTPCRVADTREADGPFAGPLLMAGTSRDFLIPQGSCGIPVSALAYALNVTVIPTGKLDYLTLSPTGETRPLVSTLNSYDGRVKANAAIVAAGTGGGINVFAANDTHVVIDVAGYFDIGLGSETLFTPVTPCRVMDTRNSDGPLGGPDIAAHSARDVPVQQSACNLPTDATAYALNLTAIPHGPLNFLTAWPSGQTQPGISTLNAPTGTVVANAALIQGGSSGDISAFATQDTDLVIDANGLFVPSWTSGALHFYRMAPCRALDTRMGIGPLSGAATYDVGTACGVPLSAQAVVVNATVVPQGSLKYLTLWPAGEAKPLVSALNALDGSVTSNMAIIAVTDNKIGAFASGTTDLILDVTGYFAP